MNIFSKKKDKTENKTEEENTVENKITEEENITDKVFERFKSDMLAQFDKKIEDVLSDHKSWLEQYQRNMKYATETVTGFETKINAVRETLEKSIDDKKYIAERIGLNKVLEFDRIFKYQTSNIINLPNDLLTEFRDLGEVGNWEIIILAKKL